MARLINILLPSVILSFPLSNAVTIGLEGIKRMLLPEAIGNKLLCASVMDNSPSNYAANIDIAYEDRSAYGNIDYEETPHHFLFTPNSSRHCFNLTIINDDNYEVREEFYVNLTTTDNMVTLSPNFVIIVLDDDERVVIGWEQSSYTVGEGDGQLRVCITLTGYLETVLQQSSIRAAEGTAIRGNDFSFPDDVLIFPKTSNSSSKKCYTVTLIKDVEYEEVKNFTIFIVNNGLQRLTRDPQTTTIVITDYNVIIEQQPSSLCDGVNNFIHFSATCSINSSTCDILTCSTSDWSLSLSIDGCNREVTLNVTDYDEEEVSKIFTSQVYAQELNHTHNNQTGRITLTSRVVRNGDHFYNLLSIHAPLFNLSFPTTAIPVECFLQDFFQSQPPKIFSETSTKFGSTNVTMIGTVSGAMIAILTVYILVLTVFLIYLCKRRVKISYKRHQEKKDFKEITQNAPQNPSNRFPSVIAMTSNKYNMDHQVSHMTSNMSYNSLVPPAEVVMTTNESYATPHQENMENDYKECS